MERRAVMTDIETRARDALNEVRGGNFWLADATRKNTYTIEAMCREIEAHEAFRQEVSDAVLSFWKYTDAVPGHFKRFIIAKPDPLVEAMLRAWPQYADRMDACSNDAAALRAAIEKRGGKIIFNEE